MYSEVTTKVPIPNWIFEQAKDQEELKGLVLQYMQRYPYLKVKKILTNRRIAVCVDKERL